MNHPFNIALLVLVIVILFLFILIRNKKDKKDLEHTLNQDYKKPKDREGDTETDLKAD